MRKNNYAEQGHPEIIAATELVLLCADISIASLEWNSNDINVLNFHRVFAAHIQSIIASRCARQFTSLAGPIVIATSLATNPNNA